MHDPEVSLCARCHGGSVALPCSRTGCGGGVRLCDCPRIRARFAASDGRCEACHRARSGSGTFDAHVEPAADHPEVSRNAAR